MENLFYILKYSAPMMMIRCDFKVLIFSFHPAAETNINCLGLKM